MSVVEARAVFQRRDRGRYILLAWNHVGQCWKVLPEESDEPFPDIPVSDSWVYQVRREGQEWMTPPDSAHYPKTERPQMLEPSCHCGGAGYLYRDSDRPFSDDITYPCRCTRGPVLGFVPVES